MNQYSLTETTSLLEKHYFLQNEKIKNIPEVLNYNNHKIRHTYAVLFVTQKLLTYEKDIFSTKEKIKKAEVASLLHDIGRFYQNDGIKVLGNNEFEHGDFGYKLLKKEGIDDLSILLAVKYHNKKNIDGLYLEDDFLNADKVTKEEILDIVKLTRDADKIQNLEYILFNPNDRLYLNYELNNSLNLKKLNNFLNGILLDNNNINTYVEYYLLISCWIYDLNFKTSYKFLKQDGFIDFIISKLKDVSLDKYIILKVKNRLEDVIDKNIIKKD